MAPISPGQWYCRDCHLWNGGAPWDWQPATFAATVCARCGFRPSAAAPVAGTKSGIVAFRVTAALMAQIDGVRRALDSEKPAGAPHSRTEAIHALIREELTSRKTRRSAR
jgi:hypothetical protein